VRCTLDVVRVQLVRWCKGDTVKGGDFIGEVYIGCGEGTVG